MATCPIIQGPWFRQVRGSLKLHCPTSEFRCSQSAHPVTVALTNLHSQIASGFRCAPKAKQDFVLDTDITDFQDEAFQDEDEEGDSDEDDGLESMQDWKRNKPPGFGVGKEYDLSLETKLLDEIERDRKAQAAAKNARKAGGKASKVAKKPVVEPPADGFVVKVSNLPKKKNVERDLRAAFKGVQGLLHVRPVHTGNEKTREPTCTGLAFLTFAKETDADRFVRVSSGQLVKFGKVEKKLFMERASSDSNNQEVLPSTAGLSRLRVRESGSQQTASATEYLSALQLKGRQVPENPTSAVAAENAVLEDNVSDDEPVTLEDEIWSSLEDEDDDLVDAELEDENRKESIVAGVGDDDHEESRVDKGHQSSDGSLEELPIQAEGTRKVKMEVEAQVIFGENETKSSVSVSQVQGNDTVLDTTPAVAPGSDAEDSESDQVDSDDEEFTDMSIELETWGIEDAQDVQGEAPKLLSREVVLDSSQDLEKTVSNAVDEKDKKIEELERMVMSLQSKLKATKSSPKQVPVKKLTEEESRQAAEARIEALEKRVFWKVKSAVNSREKSTSKEKVTKRAAEKTSKSSSPTPKIGKLGSSMRLKKKDRASFSGVLEKYSRQEATH